MNIQEYGRNVVDTAKEDWNIITCWGYGSGPSYHHGPPDWSTTDGAGARIAVQSHGMVASLKSDLSISIAWGITSNPDFREAWANDFVDPQASSGFVDFFYQGILVFRDTYVNVDGGRCRLPLPDREFDRETKKVARYTVPRDKYSFFRMFDGFEQVSDFDRCFKAAGFEIIDTPWMA